MVNERLKNAVIINCIIGSMKDITKNFSNYNEFEKKYILKEYELESQVLKEIYLNNKNYENEFIPEEDHYFARNISYEKEVINETFVNKVDGGMLCH